MTTITKYNSFFDQWNDDLCISRQEADYSPDSKIYADIVKGEIKFSNFWLNTLHDYLNDFQINLKHIKINKFPKSIFPYLLDINYSFYRKLFYNLTNMPAPFNIIWDVAIKIFKFETHDVMIIGEQHNHPSSIMIKKNLCLAGEAFKCAIYLESVTNDRYKEINIQKIAKVSNTHFIFGLEDVIVHALTALYHSINCLIYRNETNQFILLLYEILEHPKIAQNFKKYIQFKNCDISIDLGMIIEACPHINLKSIMAEYYKLCPFEIQKWFSLLQGFGRFLLSTKTVKRSPISEVFENFFYDSLTNIKLYKADQIHLQSRISCDLRDKIFVKNFLKTVDQVPKEMPIVLNVGLLHVQGIFSQLT